MLTVDKYIIRQFMGIFFLSMVTLISFYEMVVFFDTVGYFFKHKATLDEITRFMFFKTPTALLHVTPISVLLGSLLTMVSMSRYSEIVALKASGVSPLRIGAPIMVVATVISIFSFLNDEYFVHLAAKETKRIYYDEIKEQPRKGLFNKDMYWYKGDDGSIWNIGHIDKKGKRLSDLSIFYFDDTGKSIVKRVTASEGRLEGDKWRLTDYVEREFYENGAFDEKSEGVRYLPEAAIPSKELDQVKLYPEEMNLSQMKAYIADIRSKGYDATSYVVDMHAKVSFPFISLVIAIMAIPLGIKSSRTGGTLIGIGVAVVTAAVFWFSFSMLLAIGRAGLAPPMVAAYGAHIFFGTLGIFVLTRRAG